MDPTIKVRMLKTAARPEGNWLVGSVQNLPKYLAEAFCKLDIAVLVVEPEDETPVEPETPEPETAMEEPRVETAVKPPPRRRRKSKRLHQ